MPKKIVSVQDNIKLSIVHSVTKQKVKLVKTEDGTSYPSAQEVNVKQLHVQKWFKKDGITSVEEYVTAKNTIAKSRCIVFDKYSGRFYATFHSAKDVIESISYVKTNPIGYDTVHSTRSQVHKY
jgi:hypothetical protein